MLAETRVKSEIGTNKADESERKNWTPLINRTPCYPPLECQKLSIGHPLNTTTDITLDRNQTVHTNMVLEPRFWKAARKIGYSGTRFTRRRDIFFLPY